MTASSLDRGPGEAEVPFDAPPILLADDDEIALRLTETILDVLKLVNPRWIVGNGDDAVERLERCLRGEAPVPALVMLDGQMPGRSGLQILRWMREQPPLAGVPVIMLTGVSDVGSIRDAYDSGALSYLVKPVGFQALTDVLKGLQRPWLLL